MLAEDHYYPFGLEMVGISDQAALKPESFFKYNGNELQHKEFSDGSGLEEYDYGARFYDPQIGRFGTIDKFSEKYTALSPYQYCMDNPMRFVDLHGDSIIISKLLTENFIANEAFNNFAKSK
ncbi:MAG: RHS repeat-associated core domain-containing protein [Thermoanaerobacterium sp.]|nr:RHS repeat-associated core domain-containing protein [Thermoanaerobacterium sp.]